MNIGLETDLQVGLKTHHKIALETHLKIGLLETDLNVGLYTNLKIGLQTHLKKAKRNLKTCIYCIYAILYLCIFSDLTPSMSPD